MRSLLIRLLFRRALKNYIEKRILTVEAILLTHAHFDHIMGIDGF